ncbi:MAG: metallophosphoesterase [Myxococcota bacterium]|nr:metallophosphoesterase [Myxococcota bacterium]
MRHLIIGDVHGMAEELRALVDRLAPGPEDTLVFVGDLVDKGPESPEVVAMVRALADRARVVLVEGNHEEKHRRFRRHLAAGSKVADQMGGAEEMRAITAELSDADVAFLDTALPFHRIEAHGVLVVHAGIPGDMRRFPESVEVVGQMSNKQRKSFQRVLRTRFLSAETGKFLMLGRNEPGDPYWADVYDGRFGHVVFGHEPFLEGPRVFDHATGIDTGAVFGGPLTALVLGAGDPARSFVSVPSRGKYCAQFGE